MSSGDPRLGARSRERPDMNVVLVSSPQPNAGKSASIVGLGQRLRRAGVQVAYRRLPGTGASADAAFVSAALRQSEPLDRVLTPLQLMPANLPPNADVTLVEASSEAPFTPGDLNALEEMKAVSLVVARYQAEGLLQVIRDHVVQLSLRSTIVLFTAVPEKGVRQVRQRIIPALQEFGISVAGIIPQDRILLGITVGELAESLGAAVLCAGDQLDLPVEAVMISAMSDEGAEEYFRRISRKVVVAGGDRPDIHMPALATDTSCIVLTEGHDPDPTVFKTADELGVPLLKVSPSTVETLEHISEALARARFQQSYKVAREVALFSANVDEEALFRDLGVARREISR